MSTTANVHEAKTHPSRPLERVSWGEVVITAEAGKPVARFVAVRDEPKRRRPGSAKGTMRYADDFDAPLTDGIQRPFE